MSRGKKYDFSKTNYIVTQDYKKIGILALNFIFSFWFWIIVKRWVTSEVLFVRPSEWLPSLTGLIVLAAVIGLSFLVLTEQKFWWRWAISWIVGLNFLIVFGFSLLNLGAIVVVALLQAYAIRITKIETLERLRIHVGLILRRGMPAVLIPILLAISFVYYETGVFEEKIVNRDVSFSIRQIVSDNINTVLNSKTVEENDLFSEIDDTTREQTIDKVFSFALEQFDFYTDKYQNYIPPVLAFGLFLILWGLSFIFIWTSVWLAMLIYELLILTKFIKLETEKIDAQRLRL